MAPERIEGFAKGDEVAGNEARALVDELIERVLTVGAGFTPINRTSFIVDGSAIESDVLAVALHGELLEIGREALEVLLVGQNGYSLRAEEIGVPDTEKSHEYGKIALEGGGAEMLIHFVKAAAAWSGNSLGRWRAW